MSKSAKGSIANPGTKVKAKSGLNRSILNEAWHKFFTYLEYKLKLKGGILIKVNPQHTSQTCPQCGHISKDNRKEQEIFKCVKCGYEANADHNAAQNILRRAGQDLPPVKRTSEEVGSRSPPKLTTAALLLFSGRNHRPLGR